MNFKISEKYKEISRLEKNRMGGEKMNIMYIIDVNDKIRKTHRMGGEKMNNMYIINVNDKIRKTQCFFREFEKHKVVCSTYNIDVKYFVEYKKNSICIYVPIIHKKSKKYETIIEGFMPNDISYLIKVKKVKDVKIINRIKIMMMRYLISKC